MTALQKPEFDQIGIWSELKLEIVRKYAQAYSRIFRAQKQVRRRFKHVYVDAFSGSGVHISRTRGELVPGSPLNALWVQPPFEEFHFVDLDGDKIQALREVVGMVGDDRDVHIYHGDCNEILLEKVFPRIRFEEYERGLCLLDPYGLDLDWKVVEAAGRSNAIDMFLNFPIMDMNRNALWRHPEAVGEQGRIRMNAFWGDEEWLKVAYRREKTLLGDVDEKADNRAIVEAYLKRLRAVAHFDYVAEPLPMRNSRNAVVYYLIFASQKPVAKGIAEDIFRPYRSAEGT